MAAAVCSEWATFDVPPPAFDIFPSEAGGNTVTPETKYSKHARRRKSKTGKVKRKATNHKLAGESRTQSARDLKVRVSLSSRGSIPLIDLSPRDNKCRRRRRTISSGKPPNGIPLRRAVSEQIPGSVNVIFPSPKGGIFRERHPTTPAEAPFEGPVFSVDTENSEQAERAARVYEQFARMNGLEIGLGECDSLGRARSVDVIRAHTMAMPETNRAQSAPAMFRDDNAVSVDALEHMKRGARLLKRCRKTGGVHERLFVLSRDNMWLSWSNSFLTMPWAKKVSIHDIISMKIGNESDDDSPTPKKPVCFTLLLHPSAGRDRLDIACRNSTEFALWTEGLAHLLRAVQRNSTLPDIVDCRVSTKIYKGAETVSRSRYQWAQR
eukprot:205191_1